jgi:hypothetical protein
MPAKIEIPLDLPEIRVHSRREDAIIRVGSAQSERRSNAGDGAAQTIYTGGGIGSSTGSAMP